MLSGDFLDIFRLKALTYTVYKDVYKWHKIKSELYIRNIDYLLNF